VERLEVYRGENYLDEKRTGERVMKSRKGYKIL